MNTTELVVEIRLQKNSGPSGILKMKQFFFFFFNRKIRAPDGT